MAPSLEGYPSFRYLTVVTTVALRCHCRCPLPCKRSAARSTLLRTLKLSQTPLYRFQARRHCREYFIPILSLPRWALLHLRDVSRGRIRSAPGDKAHRGRERGEIYRRTRDCCACTAQLYPVGSYTVDVSEICVDAVWGWTEGLRLLARGSHEGIHR